MTKIVVKLHPFVLNQNVYILQDNIQIKMIQSTVESLSDNLFTLTKKYYPQEIYLAGAKQISEQISKDFQEKEMIEYGQNNIIIHLI